MAKGKGGGGRTAAGGGGGGGGGRVGESVAARASSGGFGIVGGSGGQLNALEFQVLDYAKTTVRKLRGDNDVRMSSLLFDAKGGLLAGVRSTIKGSDVLAARLSLQKKKLLDKNGNITKAGSRLRQRVIEDANSGGGRA